MYTGFRGRFGGIGYRGGGEGTGWLNVEIDTVSVGILGSKVDWVNWVVGH